MGNCSDQTGFEACWKTAYTLTVAGPLWITLWPALVALGFTDVGKEILDWSNSEVQEYFKKECAHFLDCSYPDRDEDTPADTGDGEDLIGTMAGDIEGTEAGGTPAGDMAGSLEEPLITTPDTDISLYEYWKIGYLTSTIDSNGLVLDNNFNLNYGTYIYLDADGNIYDAATFKGNVATRDDVTIEVDPDAVDSNIDTSILTDEELSGISSFKIEETLLSHTESEYFIVGWAYGSTARPEFEYTFITGMAGEAGSVGD